MTTYILLALVVFNCSILIWLVPSHLITKKEINDHEEQIRFLDQEANYQNLYSPETRKLIEERPGLWYFSVKPDSKVSVKDVVRELAKYHGLEFEYQPKKAVAKFNDSTKSKNKKSS